MTSKKDEAQSARAARLHKKIEEIKQGKDDSPGPPAAPGKAPSPRDFIHKRMRELKEKK